MQVVYHATINLIFSQPLIIITEKRCTTCLTFKSLDGFGNDKVQQDQMKAVCKECRKNPAVKSFNNKLITSPETKICTKCLAEKSYDDFNKMEKTTDSYHPHCRVCQSEYNQQHRSENIEHYHEYDRNRVGNPKRNAQHMSRYYEKYSQDPAYMEAKNRSSRNWYKANRMKARENLNRYIARKRATRVDRVSYKSILERDGYFCYLCQAVIDPKDLSFDHVIPLRPRPGHPQGTHTEDNIRPAHKKCNARKSNKPFGWPA